MPGVSAASTLAANLDIARLFDQAHWIVKVVMLLLAVMFIVGLYIIIYKTMYIRRASGESNRFIDSFWRSRDIEQIYKQAQALRNSPVSQMFGAGYTELAKLANDENLKGDREGNLANIERALRRAQTVEGTKLESMVPFLATTGSAAPFIGLFGTVVGIIKAFHNMAIMGSGGFSVVASGISEALVATALGLIVAIIAVIFYNYFQTRIERIEAALTIASNRVLDAIHLGRQAHVAR
jgi:biopolymer transport protein TolQ